MSTLKKIFFNNTRTLLLAFILFLTLYIICLVIFSHEVFAMSPYDNIIYDEDMISDEDVRSRLTIARKEEYKSYKSYNGKYTYNTRQDIFESLYPGGLPIHYSIINDSYDGENYFDIPITMIYRGAENINLSSGFYSGCTARNIDGLLI
jgi:hypothetical protein